MVSMAASATRPFSSLRRVEVRSAARAVLPSGANEEDQTTIATSTEMVVVPLPRRSLFPLTHTSAYMENQPALRTTLSHGGKGMLVAAFMLRDSKDYKGCILRPGLEGQDLLTRLHSVGTIAEVEEPVNGTTGRVELLGHRRVKMVGCVGDNPLTVRVVPLQVKSYAFGQLNRYQKDMAEEAFQAIRALLPDEEYMAKLKGLISHPEGLAWFGPSMLPVEDKALHQRALEELDGAKRLGISLEILKREVELDRTGGWVPKPHEDYTDEEKEALAGMTWFGRTCYKLIPDQSDYTTGQAVFAPSIELRIKLAKFRKWLSPETVAFLKESHSVTRLAEYIYGY